MSSTGWPGCMRRSRRSSCGARRDPVRALAHRQTAALSAEVAAFRPAHLGGLATPAALDLPLAEICRRRRRPPPQSGWFGRKKRLIAVRDSLAPVLHRARSAPQGGAGAGRRPCCGADRGPRLAARAAAIPGVAVAGGLEPAHRSGRSVDQRDRLAPAAPARRSTAADRLPRRRCAATARQGPTTNPAAAARSGQAGDAVGRLLAACRSSRRPARRVGGRRRAVRCAGR